MRKYFLCENNQNENDLYKNEFSCKNDREKMNFRAGFLERNIAAVLSI